MKTLTSVPLPDIQQALMKDRFALRRDWQKLQTWCAQQNTTSIPNEKIQLLEVSIASRLQASVALHQQRKDKILNITYPEQLPVSERRQDIADLIEQHPLVIVAGETGSGKTTQLAKLCLQMGRGRAGMIAHTQPRRVAASSVAARIAEEMQVTLGQEVGYQVRFTDYSNEHTLLKLMTDGVLLAEIPHDRLLEKYDTIIIDEAHERSLNIDFLLGYIKNILPQRPDLKVIITSATIDVERFSSHFNDAPVITVSGRSFPVEVCYRPFDNDEAEQPLSQAILNTLDEIEATERANPQQQQLGDVLVFLPGEHDIRQTSLLLRRAQLPSTEVLPLYARLSASEQRRIFHIDPKKTGRRVILATNVAETSLTVPGICYVIDSGLARLSRYSHRSKVQRLPIEKISQASASQRAGRCGRIAAGVCYRLYSEEDFIQREAFTQPEIQRTNLASVILQMQMMRLGDIEAFPFLEKPDSRLINDGFKQLVELGALTEKRQITPLGKQLGMLPIDPRFARMLVQANKERSLHEMLVIVSALSIQDPRENPADKREAAREKHVRFADTDSDFSAILKLWNYVEEQRQNLSVNQWNRQAGKEFLASQRLREWRETHVQLKRICSRLQFRENSEPATYNAIHRALLSGLVTQVGCQREDKQFDSTRSRQFRIFPASHLFRKPPKWIMAAELMETTQLYAHYVAKMDTEWLRDLAPHLLKHSYSEPHWSAKEGQVMAFERTSLYGLVLTEKRRVSYAKIDAKLSREIFIRSALVEEQLRSNAAFYNHNRQLKQQLADIEEKSRRRDVMANDDAVFHFYDQLIPAHVVNFPSFEQWRKQAEQQQPQLLFAPQALFQSGDLADYSEQQFPDHLEWNGVNYALQYRFEPSHEADGISVQLPVAVLNRVPGFRFEWLVPGMLAEKCEALIKSLPKQYRKKLVPIPQTVMHLLPSLKAGDYALETVLSEAILKKYGERIPHDAWQKDKLDDYYKMNFQLLDEEGKLIRQSRDLMLLIKLYGHKVQQALNQKVAYAGNKKQFTRWDFGDIEQQKVIEQSGSVIQSYPALLDEGDTVSITLTDYVHVQQQIHRKGLIRLAMLELSTQTRYLRKELLKGNELQLQLSSEYNRESLLDDLIAAAFNHTFFADTLPFSESEFKAIILQHSSRVVAKAQELEKLLRIIVRHDYTIRQHLLKLGDRTMAMVKKDVDAQRAALVYPGFIYQTPAVHFYDLPRYFSSLSIRLERLQGQLQKDIAYTAELQELWGNLLEISLKHPGVELLPSVMEYRWMLEEYRVSLFSQQLKTRIPVSKKRLEKQWENIMADMRLLRI